jgi:Fe-S-cluster-containing hydrogenase component 2
LCLQSGASSLTPPTKSEEQRNMSRITIDLPRCDASPLCPARRVCPRGAIVPVPGGYTVDQEKCTACGVCMRACPMGAVELSQ